MGAQMLPDLMLNTRINPRPGFVGRFGRCISHLVALFSFSVPRPPTCFHHSRRSQRARLARILRARVIGRDRVRMANGHVGPCGSTAISRCCSDAVPPPEFIWSIFLPARCGNSSFSKGLTSLSFLKQARKIRRIWNGFGNRPFCLLPEFSKIACGSCRLPEIRARPLLNGLRPETCHQESRPAFFPPSPRWSAGDPFQVRAFCHRAIPRPTGQQREHGEDDTISTRRGRPRRAPTYSFFDVALACLNLVRSSCVMPNSLRFGHFEGRFGRPFGWERLETTGVPDGAECAGGVASQRSAVLSTFNPPLRDPAAERRCQATPSRHRRTRERSLLVTRCPPPSPPIARDADCRRSAPDGEPAASLSRSGSRSDFAT